jgi:hypothetical protein
VSLGTTYLSFTHFVTLRNNYFSNFISFYVYIDYINQLKLISHLKKQLLAKLCLKPKLIGFMASGF